MGGLGLCRQNFTSVNEHIQAMTCFYSIGIVRHLSVYTGMISSRNGKQRFTTVLESKEFHDMVPNLIRTGNNGSYSSTLQR